MFQMDRLFFLFLALIAVSYYSLSNIYNVVRSPLNKIPGPWWAKWTHWPLKYWTIRGWRMYFIDNLHKKYGKIVRVAPGEVSVTSVSAYKQIYGTGSKFQKHEWYQWFTGHDRPAMFTMSDIEQHGQRRRWFARAFSKSQLRSEWEPEIRGNAQAAVRQIRRDLESHDTCETMKWFRLMANDGAARIMFGESWNLVEKGETNDLIKVLELFVKVSAIAVELPLILVIGKIIPIKAVQLVFNGWDYVTDYAKVAVVNSKKTGQQGSKNIFGSILEKAEDPKENISDTDIRHEAGNFMVAGTDTTSITLTFLIWAVISHPELQTAIEKEVSTLAPNHTDEDVERLPLLNAVIKETNRLYGAVLGSFPRVPPQGGAVVDGFQIPEGTIISAQGYTVQRSEEYFEDALKFKPERWLSDAKISSGAKVVYNPFGPGSRICLGMHFAMMEIRLTAAQFFRECKGVKLAPSMTEDQMQLLNFFGTFPRGGRLDLVR